MSVSEANPIPPVKSPPPPPKKERTARHRPDSTCSSGTISPRSEVGLKDGEPSDAALPPASRGPVPVPVGPAPTVRVREEGSPKERETEAVETAVRLAPPWLVSGIVHMSILIALAVFYLGRERAERVDIEAVFADELGQQLEDDLLQMAQLEMPDLDTLEPALSRDLTFVQDPLAAPPELDISLEAFSSTSQIEAPSIGIALTGREKGAKEALLAGYGGTAITEAAVTLGLEWLAKQQDARSGLWSLTGPYADGGAQENHVAATAMALLALQGAGHTHKAGTHKRAVQRGIEALVKLQDNDGNFFQKGPYHHRMYSQAQATIAVCELYGMTKDDTYRRAAQKALDYATWSQSPTLGGWRYLPRKESDTSVTGWFVMALMSGKMAGLEVPSPTLDAISRYLDRATIDGVRYSYRPGEAATLTMTAEGLLCRQYLGWEHNDARLREGIEYLLQNPVDYDEENPYYWYYATQVLHHMGGDAWNRWNRIMRDAIPARQVKQGRECGSWSPDGDKRWGGHGGRLYTTCLSIYNLEVYYRHLPIYQH